MTASGRHTVAVLFSTFLPYVVARLVRANGIFGARGWRMVGIESMAFQAKYPWRCKKGDEEFERITLVQNDEPPARISPTRLNREMRLALDRLRPSAVAVCGYSRPEMRAAVCWARTNGALYVLMSDSKYDDHPRCWWKELFKRRFVSRFDSALVGGDAAREYLVTLGMKREMIFAGYDAVDNDGFASVSAKLRRHEEAATPSFLACCRLLEHPKNILRLLRAYRLYRERTDDAWKLVICGNGPDRSLYEATIASEKLAGVELVGHKEIDELARFYASAGCFIHPTLKDTWGLVVNEAMASGLPVLVSRRAGCAHDLVHEDVNGWTFNPYDIEEMAELMLRVTRLPAEQRDLMGKESQRIVSRWNTNAFAEGLMRAIHAAERARNMARKRGTG